MLPRTLSDHLCWRSWIRCLVLTRQRQHPSPLQFMLPLQPWRSQQEELESVPIVQTAVAASTPAQLMLPLQPHRSQNTFEEIVGIGTPCSNCSGSINGPSAESLTATVMLPEYLCRRSWNWCLVLKLQREHQFHSIHALKHDW